MKSPTHASRPTLQEIADELGVTSMTVSKALRGVGRISEETRQRVREKAEAMGYLSSRERLFPPFVKGNTSGHCTRVLCPTVGALDRGEINPYRNDMITGLERAFTNSADEIVVQSFASLDELLACVRAYKFHGVVLSEPYPTRWIHSIREICPVIYTVGHDFQAGVDSIYFNEARAAALTVDRLTRAGHQQIGWLGILDRNASFFLPQKEFSSKEVADRLALTVHGTRYASWFYLANQHPRLGNWPVRLIERDWASSSLADIVRLGCRELLQETPRPSVIVCASNAIAREVIHQLENSGYHVPRDISVVSYGVEEHGSTDEGAQITGVVMPMDKVGNLVLEMIQRCRAYPEGLALSIQLDVSWSDGETLAPPNSSL